MDDYDEFHLDGLSGALRPGGQECVRAALKSIHDAVLESNNRKRENNAKVEKYLREAAQLLNVAATHSFDIEDELPEGLTRRRE